MLSLIIALGLLAASLSTNIGLFLYIKKRKASMTTDAKELLRGILRGDVLIDIIPKENLMMRSPKDL